MHTVSLARRAAFVAALVTPALVAPLAAGAQGRPAPAGAPARGDVARGDAALVAEARAFMTAYARDLRAGDRAALAARYDRAGAYVVGNGKKQLMAFDSIGAMYARSWQPPSSFDWQDLSYEPVGRDAILVVGRFAWGVGPAAPPIAMSYTGLLRRRDGVLRIRLEDESPDPATLPKPAAPPDSARR